jgi:hypothetical protein
LQRNPWTCATWPSLRLATSNSMNRWRPFRPTQRCRTIRQSPATWPRFNWQRPT